MRIVLLGKNGRVGTGLYPTLENLGDIFAFDSSSLDINDALRVETTLRDIRPHMIINAAAYTPVDKAETQPNIAIQVNAIAPKILAEVSKSIRAILIHFSTSYVFDGANAIPYKEYDMPNPINVYGKSKLAGEKAIQDTGCAFLILRTNWVYSIHGDNFLTKILSLSRQSRKIIIVSDQIGSPTWVGTLADITSKIISSYEISNFNDFQKYKGIYHVTDLGSVSPLEWAQAILRIDPDRGSQITETLQSALSSEFTRSARRPLFSALNCGKIQRNFNVSLQNWEERLKIAMKD